MAIELKNKLVTLEDLQVAYNALVEQIGGEDMWTDITGELTWQTGKAIKRVLVSAGEYAYSWVTPSSDPSTSDVYIAKCRYADVDGIEAGKRYRITGWTTGEITHALYAVLDSDGNLIDAGFPTGIPAQMDKAGCGEYFYRTIEVTVPVKGAKLMVLNWNKQMDTSYSLTDIKVETR